MDKLILVYGEDGDCSIVVNKRTMSVLYTYDHSDPNVDLLESLGFDVMSFYHSELVSEDEYTKPTRSDLFPNMELVMNKLKEMV